MTIARRDIVDTEIPGFYHCTNRCVRRTFLCGLDELTGKDFSHRKDWLEHRMFELCDIFSVDIYAYAVMGHFLRPAKTAYRPSMDIIIIIILSSISTLKHH